MKPAPSGAKTETMKTYKSLEEIGQDWDKVGDGDLVPLEVWQCHPASMRPDRRLHFSLYKYGDMASLEQAQDACAEFLYNIQPRHLVEITAVFSEIYRDGAGFVRGN